MKQLIQISKGAGLFKYFLVYVFLSLFHQSSGQRMPPFQPEQDACNALILCGNSFTTPYSYVGSGRIFESAFPIREDNSVWLRLNVNTAGTIVFTINPINIFDDYDFAVFDISTLSCSTFSNANAIRYNFKNNYGAPLNGVTGLSDTATVQFVAGGSSVYPFCQQVNANAGDTYLIMINNWGSSGSGISSGFTIDFTGSTATFNQPPKPELVRIQPNCNYRNVVIDLDQPVLCSSIAADGSDFYLSPSGNIASIEGINCNGNLGYTRQVRINFTIPLTNGYYVLHAQNGTDGNTLLSLCNVALSLQDTIGFSVHMDPLLYASIDSPACQVLSVRLNRPVFCESIAADGSDFVISGPSPVTILSASGAPACVPGSRGGITEVVKLTLAQPIPVDGIYTITAQTGSDGDVLTDSCGKEQEAGDTITFRVHSFNGLLQAFPDTLVCENVDEVNLYAVNKGLPPANGFSYAWEPAHQVQDTASLSTTATISPGQSAFILTTLDRNGCYLRDSAIIDFAPFPEAIITPESAVICLGDELQLTGAGGDTYRWFDNAALSAPNNTSLSCTYCDQPFVTPLEGSHTYYLEVTSVHGCKDTTQATVQVHGLPGISATPEEISILYGGSVQLGATGGVRYTWSPGTFLDNTLVADPIAAQVVKNIIYTVTGENEYGCTGADSVSIRIDGFSPDFIPNAFSPNGDGKNDVFRVGGITYQQLKEFRVFDRWGNCVFVTMDVAQGWDGYYKGEAAASGTYFYLVRLVYPDGSEREYKGDVLLVR